MAPKAPSEGTKVDFGMNAPAKNEPAGTVPSESLAAQSYREGGTFANNVGSQPENLSNSQLKSVSGASMRDPAPNTTTRSEANDTTSWNAASYDQATDSGSFRPNPRSYAGTAPTYVNNQYIRDPHGPHGTNIQEGFDDAGVRDGVKTALGAEPGSMNDPARMAEQQAQLNQNAMSRAAGPKEGSLSNETKYDSLNSEASA